MQIVKRLTLNNTVKELVFGVKGSEFLVKNFSDNDLLVSFDKDTLESEWIKIPSKTYQVCIVNGTDDEKRFLYRDCIYRDKIYLKGEGEVEVQVLSWV